MDNREIKDQSSRGIVWAAVSDRIANNANLAIIIAKFMDKPVNSCWNFVQI